MKLSRSAAASKQAEIVEKILADKKRKISEDIEPPIQFNKSKQNVRWSSKKRLKILGWTKLFVLLWEPSAWQKRSKKAPKTRYRSSTYKIPTFKPPQNVSCRRKTRKSEQKAVLHGPGTRPVILDF